MTEADPIATGAECMEARPMRTLLTVAAGALMLAWPALLNGYPLVFSDTGAFLIQAALPTEVFDKPWAYAPLLLALDGRTSLWLPLAAQALVTSHLLWLTGKALGRPRAWAHLLLCLLLAAGTAAPWVTSLLMPDVFAALTVLATFLLGWGTGLRRVETAWVAVLGTIAVAVHLTHLIIAAVCLVPVLLLARRRWLPVLPLAASLVWLVGLNTVLYGKPGLSPYGSVFMLARLVGDGPGADYLDHACPDAGYRLCDWAGRLPRDSDTFLWHPDGPIWGHGSGPTLVAPEASRIVAATIRAEPLAVARTMAANTARQLLRVRVGDALGPDYLADTVGLRLRQLFPPEEGTRFAVGLQARDRLRGAAAPWLVPHLPVLLAGAAATGLALIVAAWRRRRTAAGLVLVTLAGLLANAFATGALSGPHDRYGARLAWLLVAVPILLLQAARAATSSGDNRTSAS